MNSFARSHGFLFLLLLILFPIAGAPCEGTGSNGYVIAREVFSISGRSRESSILGEIGAAQGKIFATREELATFIKEREQRLANLRIFKKSEITAEYPAESPDGISAQEPNAIPVVLRTTITDGAPVIPIPYAFYNSNEGFMSGILLNVPNVAGTLENALIVGLYEAPPDENDRLEWTNPNFMLLGTWNGIRIGKLKFTVMGNVMKMRQETEDRGVVKAEYDELKTSGSVSGTYAITNSIDETARVSVGGSPKNSVVETVDPDYLSYGPISFYWTLANETRWDTINWIGNFRSGCNAGIIGEYTVSYPASAAASDDSTREAEIKADFAGYWAPNGRFNPNFRITAMAKTGNPWLRAGSFTRGIRDTGLKGNAGVFLNATIQTKLFRAGQAELHLSPTADFAWTYTPDDSERTSEAACAVGFELLAIFDSMKNLPVKLGFGWDLRPESRLNDGQRYEIDFSFRMSY